MLKDGLVQVYTGDGKGKTTAALGQALRALGWNLKVCVFQFLKHKKNKSGELISAKKFKGKLKIIRGKQMHPYFTKKSTSVRLIREINNMFDQVIKVIRAKKYDIIILDEINNCMNDGFISTDKVLKVLYKKPKNVEIILTGRNAPYEIINKADLVTEMKSIKHPYNKGIKIRKGIEY